MNVNRKWSLHSDDEQMEVFVAQLRLAAELGRPATVHCRQAWGALREALATVRRPRMPLSEPPTRLADGPNEPAFLPWVVRAVAELRGMSAGEVAELTWRNARRLFHVDREH